MAGEPFPRQFLGVTEPLINRDEVVSLLFNVADIATAAYNIEALLEGDDDDGEEETDEG
ncbi:MAG: hypothetical protein QOG85_1997 [Gaiellaceae bacterium]|jgi:hypothetical protein|nr:hypothetical protein [Gaiellaceae bacterium]